MLYIAVTNFFTRYIVVPVRDIYTTIRYDTSSFKVMDPGNPSATHCMCFAHNTRTHQ